MKTRAALALLCAIFLSISLFGCGSSKDQASDGSSSTTSQVSQNTTGESGNDSSASDTSSTGTSSKQTSGTSTSSSSTTQSNVTSTSSGNTSHAGSSNNSSSRTSSSASSGGNVSSKQTSASSKPASASPSSKTSGVNSQPEDDWTNVGSVSLSSKTYSPSSLKGVTFSGNTLNITAGGDYSLNGAFSGAVVVNSSEKVKLRLNNVNISNTNGPAIMFLNAKKSFITIVNGTNNYLSDSRVYSAAYDAKGTLFSNDTLEIKGGGTLTVVSNFKHAISSDDDIIIEEGNIKVTSAVTDGIHANDNITVRGGKLSITASSDALESEGDIIISGGNLTLSAVQMGVKALTDISFSNASVNITKSNNGFASDGKTTLSGGTVRVTASDNGIRSKGDIFITGGNLYISSAKDGIDSDKNITISGGNSVIYAGSPDNTAIKAGDASGILTVNGGTILGTGGIAPISVSSTSKQYSLILTTALTSGKLVSISQSGGSALLTFAPQRNASTVFYSSPKLTSGMSLNIYTGGSSSGTSVDGVFSGGAYKQGTLLISAKLTSKCTTVKK